MTNEILHIKSIIETFYDVSIKPLHRYQRLFFPESEAVDMFIYITLKDKIARKKDLSELLGMTYRNVEIRYNKEIRMIKTNKYLSKNYQEIKKLLPQTV